MNGQQPTKVAVVGAGQVGATFGYALLLSGLAAEIVLVDANERRAEGEAMDLGHAVPLSRPTRIRSGDLEDCAGAAVAVIAAGTAQRPGESRLDLTARNAAIFRQIVPRLAAAAPEAIIVVATNPVDVLTHLTVRLSGFPAARVLGSGTMLDTARFRSLLGEHFGVDARSVHAFVVGEHGDTEVAIWSLANIAGMRLADFAAVHGRSWTTADREGIYEATRHAAEAIISRKGATYYAVATGIVRIVEAMLRDQDTILSVSSRIEGIYDLPDVALSLPTIVGRGGAVEVLRLQFDEHEVRALQQSAEVLRRAIGVVDASAGAAAGPASAEPASARP